MWSEREAARRLRNVDAVGKRKVGIVRVCGGPGTRGGGRRTGTRPEDVLIEFQASSERCSCTFVGGLAEDTGGTVRACRKIMQIGNKNIAQDDVHK